MKNTIDAQVEFSFRGETHCPSITLNLDMLADKSDTFQALHRVIAVENKIDTYSYLYDAMESYPIVFFNPKGNAVDYLQDNNFDFLRYKQDMEQLQIVDQITQVAQNKMGISDIDSHPDLKAALLEAYQLGVKSTQIHHPK